VIIQIKKQLSFEDDSETESEYIRSVANPATKRDSIPLLPPVSPCRTPIPIAESTGSFGSTLTMFEYSIDAKSCGSENSLLGSLFPRVLADFTIVPDVPFPAGHQRAPVNG
jgi:hypothetical protein